MKKTIFFMIIWLVMFCAVWIFMNCQHEAVHEEIFKTFNCSNITVNYIMYGLGANTMAQCQLDEKDDRAMDMTHLQNEMVGYHFDAIYLIVSLLLLVIGVLLLLPKDIEGGENA